MHPPMCELCVRRGAHLHSKRYFVFLFVTGLSVTGAFPQREEGVAGYFPPSSQAASALPQGHPGGE